MKFGNFAPFYMFADKQRYRNYLNIKKKLINYIPLLVLKMDIKENNITPTRAK